MSEEDKAIADATETVRKWLAALCMFIGALIDKLLMVLLIGSIVSFCIILIGFSFQLYNDVAVGLSLDLLPLKR